MASLYSFVDEIIDLTAEESDLEEKTMDNKVTSPVVDKCLSTGIFIVIFYLVVFDVVEMKLLGNTQGTTDSLWVWFIYFVFRYLTNKDYM